MIGDNQKVGVYLSYYVTMKPEDHADDVSKSRFEDNEELKFVAKYSNMKTMKISSCNI